MKKKREKSSKLYVDFDENARREFVLGMRKRKQERRQAAIESLEQRVKKEKKLERDSQRLAIREEHEERKRKRELNLNSNETDDDDSDDDQADQKFAMEAVAAVTDGQQSQTTKTELRDEFSNKMFGSNLVTITTTKLNDDDVENLARDEPESGAKTRAPAVHQAPLMGKKNVGHSVTYAEKMLQKLKQKKRSALRHGKDSSGHGSSKGPQRKRKSGKTTAKERRKRSKS